MGDIELHAADSEGYPCPRDAAHQEPIEESWNVRPVHNRQWEYPDTNDVLNRRTSSSRNPFPDPHNVFRKPKFKPCCNGCNKFLNQLNSHAETWEDGPEPVIYRCGPRKEVDTWEEIFQKNSIIYPKNQSFWETTPLRMLIVKLHQILPEQLVCMIVFVIYTLTQLVSCITYNAFIEAGDYLHLREHLTIHQLADEKNIKIHFKVKLFKAPITTYFWQIWCAHCVHDVNSRISWKLLQNYRKEYRKIYNPRIIK